MTTMLSESAVRVLVTPCGCWVAADATDAIPGFCRSEEEAREDLRLGLAGVRASVEEVRQRLSECTHGVYDAIVGGEPA